MSATRPAANSTIRAAGQNNGSSLKNSDTRGPGCSLSSWSKSQLPALVDNSIMHSGTSRRESQGLRNSASHAATATSAIEMATAPSSDGGYQGLRLVSYSQYPAANPARINPN